MSSAIVRIRQSHGHVDLTRSDRQIALVGLWLTILVQAAWILIAPADRAGIYDLVVLLAFTALAATAGRIRSIVAITRLILAVSFLGSVADRFGLFGAYGSAGVSWGSFSSFVEYTRDVNAFLPGSAAPVLAVLATCVEVMLGVALLIGLSTRRAAFGAALLLALFGLAMTVSLGLTSPFSYDVWVLMTGASVMATSDLSFLAIGAVVTRFRTRRGPPLDQVQAGAVPHAAVRR